MFRSKRRSLLQVILATVALASPPSFAAFSFWKAPAGTPYRYWRFVPTSINDSTSIAIVYELEYFWGGAWQTNAMTSDTAGTIGGAAATISCSSTYSGPAWGAFSGGCGSNWNTGSGTYNTSSPYNTVAFEWVLVDFGVSVQRAITGVRATINNVDSFYVEASNDGSSWTTISGSSWSGTPAGGCLSPITRTW